MWCNGVATSKNASTSKPRDKITLRNAPYAQPDISCRTVNSAPTVVKGRIRRNISSSYIMQQCLNVEAQPNIFPPIPVAFSSTVLNCSTPERSSAAQMSLNVAQIPNLCQIQDLRQLVQPLKAPTGSRVPHCQVDRPLRKSGHERLTI